MTVLKHQSVLTTGGAGQTAPGLTITAGPSAPTSQSLIALTDYLNAPMFVQTSSASNLACLSFGDRISARKVLYGAFAGTFGRFGVRVPAALQFPDIDIASVERRPGMSVWSSTGAPSGITGAVCGDLCIRRDTPTTSNQRVYRYDGTSWVGLL